MELPSYSLIAFDDIVIKVTKHGSDNFHYQFSTPGKQSAVVHEFFSKEELTIENAFKRAYSDLAHWIDVKSGHGHLARNDGVRLLIMVSRDMFNESIYKNLKDASGTFEYNGVTVEWTRSTGNCMDTTFETVVRDMREQDMESEDYRKGTVISSKVTVTTSGNDDNLGPREQYELCMKAFNHGANS